VAAHAEGSQPRFLHARRSLAKPLSLAGLRLREASSKVGGMTYRPLLFIVTSSAVAVLALGSEACKTGSRGSRVPGIFSVSTSQAVVGPEAILGQWKSKDETLDVQAGGTVLINGQSFAYTRDGWVLTIQGPQSSVTYPFQIQGDTMTVTMNGTPVVYTRVRTEAAPPPGTTGMLPAPAASASTTPMLAPSGTPSSSNTLVPGGASPGAMPAGTGAPAPSSAPAGAVVPELVGKWCAISNVNANDGGRRSSTCFALNPDGSYSYHSETASSGAFGGSASQLDDAGRWVASASAITATSNSGKVQTFNFVKQNHPKTRDPMLVVNGQAFVTFFQKPSW
jgi:hypothetical protein